MKKEEENSSAFDIYVLIYVQLNINLYWAQRRTLYDEGDTEREKLIDSLHRI